MATRIHGKDTELYIDQHDFSGIALNATVTSNREVADVTAFADTDMTYVFGKMGGNIDITGLWSAASPAWDSFLFNDLGTDDVNVSVWPEGAGAGKRGWAAECSGTSHPFTANTGDFISADVNYQAESALVYARSYWQQTSGTTTGDNSNEYQDGAISSSQIGVGFLQVFSAGGSSPTLDIKIQSDSAESMSSPTDRITFTRATGATVERKTVAGPVTDDWYRVTITAGGSSPAFTYIVAFGIVEAG